MVEQVSSLKTGVRYKETPIGKIPVDWEVVRIKDISKKFYNGGTPDTTNKDFWDGSIPWVTGADFENQKISRIRRHITNEGVKNSATNVILGGGLLVVTRTGVGKLAIAPFDIAISQDITGVILEQEKALPTYIFWYLNNNENRLKTLIQGTSINGLLREDLESFVVSLPSFSEQKEIAEILTTVDDAIEKTTQIIDKTKELKKGLMQKILTRGIGHKKFKKTEIGEIPAAWSLKNIEEVCEILDKQRVPLNKEQREMMKGDIPYYGANGIVDYINDYIFEDDLILMAEDGGYFDEYIHRPIAYLIHGKSWVNNHAHVLKVMKPNDTLWVYYSIVHKNIIPFIKGGTRSKLNQKDLRKIPIPIPPLREQKRIVDILLSVDDEFEKESNHRDQLNSLKKGLMQVLLTGKLRVTV